MKKIIFLSILIIGVIFLGFLFLQPKAEMRSGCCSYHQGVCGCQCCDGTPLSDTCRPYYPNCNGSSQPTPEPEYTPAPSPEPVPVPVPTPVPAPQKVIKTLNDAVKNNNDRNNIIWGDLVLKNLNNSTTSPTYSTIDPKDNSLKSNKEGYYAVGKVVDGDTIKVWINGKLESVRLLGIDTPETKDPRKPVQCFGKEASEKTASLVSNKNVRLESDSSQGNKDKYGRLLRYIYLEDGTNVNAELVKQGYAFAYTKYPVSQMEQFKVLEKYARENNLGLWNSCK